MAIGFDDEFDYLDDEDGSDAAEDAFAPKIKGSKKQSLVPGESAEETPEQVESKEEDGRKCPDSTGGTPSGEPEKPKRDFENVIFVVKVTTNKEDKALEMIADKVKKKRLIFTH